MNCSFVAISKPDLNGWRTWQCSRCGRRTAPTPHGADRIFAACREEPKTCVHLGSATGRTIACNDCGGTKIKVFQCGVFGECTILKPVGPPTCAGCPQFTARGVIGGTLVKRFDETNLSPGERGKRFNPSLIEDPTTPGGYLLAYRDGWAGSEIHLIRLDAKFSPAGKAWKLSLNHRRALYGKEDPRLFMHNGRLHVAYTGVIRGTSRKPSYLLTSVLYARLTENCSAVEEVFYPHYEGRNEGEKNWGFVSYGGELFAVYSISPHTILRIEGNQATVAFQTDNPAPWTGGERRGGAAPVLVGNEMWSFFHDRILVGKVRTYRTGLYTFSARPPFRVLRYIPEPIQIADGSSRPGDQYASVTFCGGSVLEGGNWLLASGVHDRHLELHRFSHAELESKLVRA